MPINIKITADDLSLPALTSAPWKHRITVTLRFTISFVFDVWWIIFARHRSSDFRLYIQQQACKPFHLRADSVHFWSSFERRLFSCVICRCIQLISNQSATLLIGLWRVISILLSTICPVFSVSSSEKQLRDPIEQFLVMVIRLLYTFFLLLKLNNSCSVIFTLLQDICWVFREIKHECIQNMSTCVFFISRSAVFVSNDSITMEILNKWLSWYVKTLITTTYKVVTKNFKI